MRGHTRSCLAMLALILMLLAGCTGGEQAGGEEQASSAGSAGEAAVDTASIPSAAARSRGVSVPERSGEDELEPLIVLQDIVYEWRLSPDRGLHVKLGFINPHDTYARARGYVFVIASASASGGGVSGVYPWNAELGEDGMPEDHTDGSHLLYRRDQEISGLIPYRNATGYYDVMRVLVYSEEGDLLIDNTLDLDVTGEPSGPMKPPVDLTL